MAKSSKKSKGEAPGEISAVAATTESSNGGAPVSIKASLAKTPAAKSPGASAKTGARRSGPTARKTGTAAKPRKGASQKNSSAPPELTPSDAQIRLRAYFISEWRTRNGVAGDPADDWLEARRQLQEEAKRYA